MKRQWTLDMVWQTLFTRRGKRSCARAAQLRRSPMHVEELESRLVPSVYVGISNGVLQINSTGAANDIAVDHFPYLPFVGPATIVTANGSSTTWADSRFTKISINTLAASGGDDINLQANVKPVDMSLGNSDAVYVGEHYNNLDRIQGLVSITGYGFGDRLAVGDFSNTRSETWQLGSGDVNSGFISRAGAATIVYTKMEAGLIVYGTGASSTYDVAQTHGHMTTLFTGSNGDTVHIRRTTGELDVNGLGNGAVITVGDGGSVQNIRGPVFVSTLYTGTYNTVIVDDQYDNALRTPKIETFTPDGGSLYTRVNGLAPAPISSRCASTQDLIVRTGAGEAVCQVSSTGPMGLGGTGALTLEGHSDQTYVSVQGDDGTAQGIRGTLRITNTRVSTGLYVYDSSDKTQRTVSLDSIIIGDGLYGQITGLAPAAIQYRYNQTSYLGLYTAPAGADINVAGTGVDTYLEVDGSNNSVLLGGARGLQGLQGQVTIHSYTGRVNVDVDNVADTQSRTVTLTTYTPDVENVEIFGLTPRPITIESDCLGRLDLEGGSGGDTFEVQNTSAYSFPTTIYTNFGNNTVNVHATSASPLSVYLSGMDTVNIGDAANGLAMVGSPVTVVGNGLGAGDTINVVDQANPGPETYTVTDVGLNISARHILNFQDFDTLALYPSLDANTAINDVHDPNLYTLTISYDPPSAAPPPGGRAAMRPSGDHAAGSLQLDDLWARLLTEAAREECIARGSATEASDAALVEFLAGTMTKSKLQPAGTLDLVWADASMNQTLTARLL
jgi:hypothetical protein